MKNKVNDIIRFTIFAIDINTILSDMLNYDVFMKYLIKI